MQDVAVPSRLHAIDLLPAEYRGNSLKGYPGCRDSRHTPSMELTFDLPLDVLSGSALIYNIDPDIDPDPDPDSDRNQISDASFNMILHGIAMPGTAGWFDTTGVL